MDFHHIVQKNIFQPNHFPLYLSWTDKTLYNT